MNKSICVCFCELNKSASCCGCDWNKSICGSGCDWNLFKSKDGLGWSSGPIDSNFCSISILFLGKEKVTGDEKIDFLPNRLKLSSIFEFIDWTWGLLNKLLLLVVLCFKLGLIKSLITGGTVLGKDFTNSFISNELFLVSLCIEWLLNWSPDLFALVSLINWFFEFIFPVVIVEWFVAIPLIVGRVGVGNVVGSKEFVP